MKELKKQVVKVQEFDGIPYDVYYENGGSYRDGNYTNHDIYTDGGNVDGSEDILF
ncbi:MAG: hypothetical protein LUF90_09495 [Rikenellaceae bacterium]|nr:hypothetical protein [Rikenellaceae bacterium]